MRDPTPCSTRAQKVIPLGSQTFSKSRIQYPQGQAPLFLTHGRGGRVWDVDGNEYVDLVCGLLPVVLGYCDPDVDAAIRAQLDKGIIFSLATELEIELAELLNEIIPSRRDGALRQERLGRDLRLRPHRARGSPGATASPSAAITAGRTGTSARRRATRACPARSAS